MGRVAKFGGTSVANHITHIDDIVNSGDYDHIVFSAPGKRDSSDTKLTDLLKQFALQRLSGTIDDDLVDQVAQRYAHIADDSVQTKQRLVTRFSEVRQFADDEFEAAMTGFGEEESEILFAKRYGCENANAFEWQVLIPGTKLTQSHLNAELSYQRLRSVVQVKNGVLIHGGFSGRTIDGKYATYARGGSDVTQAHIGVALGLDLDNFTDSGIRAASPEFVPHSALVPFLTYREVRDLTGPGNFSILHKDVVKLAAEYGLRIHVRGTAEYPNAGSQIMGYRFADKPVVGVGYESDFSVITVYRNGLDDEIGVIGKIGSLFAKNDVGIKLNTEGTDDVSVLVPNEPFRQNPLLLQYLADETKTLFGQTTTFDFEQGYGRVTVAGAGMPFEHGINAQIANVFRENRVNIVIQSQSRNKTSIMYGIKESDSRAIINALYDRFIS